VVRDAVIGIREIVYVTPGICQNVFRCVAFDARRHRWHNLIKEQEFFMRVRTLQSIILAVVTGYLACGCASFFQPKGEPVPTAPPPPPSAVEMTSPSPGPGYVWIKGAWNWDTAKGWYWERGHWNVPPFMDAVWVPPRYLYRDGQHVYVPGQWK